VAATVAAMLEEDYPDPLGPSRRREANVNHLIAEVARLHGLGAPDQQID